MVRVEFKKLTRTLTFVLFYVVMVATYITQMGPDLDTDISEVPITYEDDINEYEEILSVDNIASSYTRMFCDYMGIFIPVMVAFVAAFYWSLDRRAKMQDVIYCREISTVKLILIRISTLVISLLPAIIFPYIHMIFKMVTMYSDMSIKWGKAIGLMLLWLVPEILFVSLFVALITELISPLIAIFIQGAWWLIALQMNSLVGGISKWTLILRHNSFGSLSIWNDEWNNVIWNRTFYMLLSILIIIALMIIYDVKRKGKLNFEVKDIKRDSSKKS